MMVRQGCCDCFEVRDIAGQDRLGQSQCNGDEMGIDDVGRPRPGENAAHGDTVVEWMDDHGVEESSEAGLPGPVAPHLSDDRMRRGERRAMTQRRCQKFLGSTFAAVDRDEEPSVKNQVRNVRSSLQPLPR